MRKTAFGWVFILLFTTACLITISGNTDENPIIQPLQKTNSPARETEVLWPPVTGSDPSQRLGAFYYPWYYNLVVDGRWDHWGEGNFNPPLDIASDFYPVLGAYSESDPTVLAQHFAWLREAGVGVIISSWWGKGTPTDRTLPLMLDIADHYGIKIAFHVEPYNGRTAVSLANDIHYLYEQYGDHPAFYWTNETSRFSPDERAKGLFFIWASVMPDGNSPAVSPEYWQEALDTLHNEDPGAIVLTDQNDPVWVSQGHFDGAYNYGVLDSDTVGYTWAVSLPSDTWYVPGINPGFSARRIGYEDWVDTPRRDGGTYEDRWECMFAVGIEPTLIAVTTFNEWHEGTQIEPAAKGVSTPNGYDYLDYGSLPPDAYLKMTRDWADVFLHYKWPTTTPLRIRMQTTSDWTELFLNKGATLQRVDVVSTIGEETNATIFEGRLSLGQPIDQAISKNKVEAIFDVQVKDTEDENSVVLIIERGGLGATWVEIYRFSGAEWIMVENFSWSGHSVDDRNSSSFNIARETIFGELP